MLTPTVVVDVAMRTFAVNAVVVDGGCGHCCCSCLSSPVFVRGGCVI